MVWLIPRWRQVHPLAPDEMEEQLRIGNGRNAPSTLQGVLDHAHGSYSLDLDAAAWRLQRQGL